MHPRHIVQALLTVTIWGLTFVAIQVALGVVPPLFLSALRFFLSAFPALFFIRPPKTSWKKLALYGLSIFALQFAFLFTGMKVGVPAGLASLVHQSQVFFTMIIAMRLVGDRPPIWSWIGALAAFGGIVIIGLHSHGDVKLVGLAIVLVGSFFWGLGNVAAKLAGKVNPFGLVVWGSLLSVPPLLAASLVLEGPTAIAASIVHMTPAVVGSLAYLSLVSTLLGYSMWASLMRQYPSSTVAPFTLLVPIVGFIGAAILLGEPVPGWKLWAAGLVVSGLVLNLFGPRLASTLRRLAVAREP